MAALQARHIQPPMPKSAPSLPPSRPQGELLAEADPGVTHSLLGFPELPNKRCVVVDHVLEGGLARLFQPARRLGMRFKGARAALVWVRPAPACAHWQAHAHTLTHTYTCMHARTRTHAHTHTHMLSHRHTHTYTHTHTHMCIGNCPAASPCCATRWWAWTSARRAAPPGSTSRRSSWSCITSARCWTCAPTGLRACVCSYMCV